MTAPAEPRRLLRLKKYPNRRYYDTTRSRHVTFEQIRDLVLEGWEVEVRDSQSGADLTRRVLTQILLEFDAGKLEVFPPALLLQLIRARGAPAGVFVEQYFSRGLQTFLEAQRRVEESFRAADGGHPLIPSVEAWTQAIRGAMPGAARPGAAPAEKAAGARKRAPKNAR